MTSRLAGRFARQARVLGLGVVMAAGLLSLFGSGGGGGGADSTPAALTVTGTSPTNSATGVAISTTVSATFSENLASTPTLTLSGGSGAVTGAVTRSGATATFTPAAALAYSTTYTASVSGGSGASGGTQSGASTWSFTTVVDPNSPPSITLASAALSFNATPGGANPAAQTVAISNGGGGTLSGLAIGTISYGTGGTGWLQAPTLNSTSAPATLTVQPVTGSLAAGTYTATLPVISGVASNSPRNITVTFTVAAVTISGTVDFESVPNDTATTSGRLLYTSITNKAVRGATVQIVAAAGGAVLASGTTSSTGTYALNIATPQSVLVRVRAELLKTSGSGGTWNFTVRDNTQTDALYTMDSAAFTPANGANTQNLRALSGWGGSSYTGTRVAGPFAILDVVYDAKEKVLSASSNATFPALQLMWSVNNRPASGNLATGLIGTSFFQNGSNGNRIYILGAADTDTDEYDRTVIAHEFGHYLQSAFSRDDSVGGSHSGGDKLDMRVAFSEGWGNAWSGMALATQYYADSSGTSQATGFRIDLAASPSGTRGWFNESSVQYLLYQFNASASIGFTPIFTVLSGLPTTLPADGALSSIHQFAYRLKLAVPAQATAIDTLLASQSITATSPIGAGETTDGGITLALPVYKAHTAALGVAQQYCVTDAAGSGGDETNKLGAHAAIRVSLASAGTRTVTVTSVTAGSDPDFLHISPAGVKTTFEAASTTTETATLSNAAAGTHLIVLYDYALIYGTSSGTINGQRCFNVTVQ